MSIEFTFIPPSVRCFVVCAFLYLFDEAVEIDADKKGMEAEICMGYAMDSVELGHILMLSRLFERDFDGGRNFGEKFIAVKRGVRKFSCVGAKKLLNWGFLN
jgi:hypothetical protein